MSFQITISPNRRAAAQFVTNVRRAILKAYVEEQKASGITQTAIARALGVHRSVINRELKGLKDITLGRVAELAWAMGRLPSFDLPKADSSIGSNLPPPVALPAEPQSTRGIVFLRASTAAATTTGG
jgi:hypothetical protein